jgi:hypothetical protein
MIKIVKQTMAKIETGRRVMPNATPEAEFEPDVTPVSVAEVALSRDDPTLGSLLGFYIDTKSTVSRLEH